MLTSPTTRVPTAGPRPSGACRSITPATSQPGREPSGAAVRARLVSPRLSEKAFTRTIAWPGAGSGIGTPAKLSFVLDAASTTTASFFISDMPVSFLTP